MYVNRFDPTTNWKALRFRSSRILQSAELNEMQSIQSHELSNIASAILEDGAILSGGGITFSDGTANIEESLVFALGYTVHVPHAIFNIGMNATRFKSHRDKVKIQQLKGGY